MRKSILVLSLLAVALVSNPLRAQSERSEKPEKPEKSLEAQVKDLAKKVESLEYDLDQAPQALGRRAVLAATLRRRRSGQGGGCFRGGRKGSPPGHGEKAAPLLTSPTPYRPTAQGGRHHRPLRTNLHKQTHQIRFDWRIVHIEQVLEYNQNPGCYLRDLLLYKLN